MLLLKGTSAALNYTYGPALVYRGPRSIDKIYKSGEPVVVIADMIPLDELRRIELTRVRGFVFEQGNAVEDEDLYNFLMTEKRAAVLSCESATDFICDGDMVIVDGTQGYVCLQPTDEVLADFQKTRKLGPPTDRGAAVQNMAKAILDGLVKEREAKEARGEKIMKSGEVISVAEAKALSAAQPGIIYQLLSGLPLPNSPTAGEHGHQHGDAEAMGGEHAHDHGDHDHDHDHAHGDEHEHEHEHAHEEKAGRREHEKSERQKQIEAARAAKRGEPEKAEKEPAPAAAAPAAAEKPAEKPAEPAAQSAPEPALAGADEDPLGYQT
jgi:hypothetical protein